MNNLEKKYWENEGFKIYKKKKKWLQEKRYK